MINKKRLYGIRGAVCTENVVSSIQESVAQLAKEIYQKNKLNEEDIVSIQFTMTSDLNVLNPAAALRKAGYGTQCALFCSAEPFIEGGLKKVIRVLITTYLDDKPVHVYTGGAEVLRPDYVSKTKKMGK